MSENKKTPSKIKFKTGDTSPTKKRSQAAETTDKNPDSQAGTSSAAPTIPTAGARAVSATGVSPRKSIKSEITATSSLDGPKLASPRNSGVGQRGVGSATSSYSQPASGMRPFQGNKHRQSGLFSKDDLSVDLSLSPSAICLNGQINPNNDAVFIFRDKSGSAIGGVRSPSTGGDGEKHYPLSIASSSVGTGSLGSGFLIDTIDRKHLYKPFRRRWRRFRRKYKGCIFALISSITSSLASHFVRELSQNPKYTPSYNLLWRYLGVFVPAIFLILYYRYYQGEMIFDTVWPLKTHEPVKKFFLTIARCLVDVASAYLNYKAFEYLLQSETSTILNSKPVVVQLLAHYTLGESWGVVPIIMSIVAAIGVMVMARPPFLLPEDHSDNSNSDFVHKRLPGVICSAASMLLASIVYCIIRYLKDVHYSVFNLYIGLVGLIFGLGLTLGLDQFVVPETWEDFTYFCAVAVLVCCSSITIVIALQNEEAFVVSLVRTFDVIFSFIWEMILTDQYPDAYRGGGAVIILFTVCVIFFRKYLTHQPTESKVYKMFHFLTK